MLVTLEDLVPGPARDELLHAAQVLTQIDAEARQACPACSGGIDEIPKILADAVDYTGGGLGSGLPATTLIARPPPVYDALGEDLPGSRRCPACSGGIDEIPKILADAVDYTGGGLAIDVVSRQSGAQADQGTKRKKDRGLTVPTGDGGTLPPGSAKSLARHQRALPSVCMSCVTWFPAIVPQKSSLSAPHGQPRPCGQIGRRPRFV